MKRCEIYNPKSITHHLMVNNETKKTQNYDSRIIREIIAPWIAMEMKRKKS